MESTKIDWEKYKEILIRFEYDEQQIENVKNVRESDSYQHVTFEQFSELVTQKVVIRTRKLKKKKRNLYLGEDGRFYYLNHFRKDWEWIGCFPENTEE